MSYLRTISRLNEATIDIVSAYISRNHVGQVDLPVLIKSVRAGLASLQPNDHIVCLEDGRRFKTLKRHLRTAYGLTPEDYRVRWGLPHDYPVVAPGYAASRAVMARQNGLGKRHRAPVV